METNDNRCFCSEPLERAAATIRAELVAARTGVIRRLNFMFVLVSMSCSVVREVVHVDAAVFKTMAHVDVVILCQIGAMYAWQYVVALHMAL